MTTTATTGDPATIFPDEVVTEAHVRYLTLPGVPGEVALITLDNGLDHTKPSSFGPAGLLSLERALDEIEAREVAAIAVTGKPFIFAVGADITGVPRITARDQALEIGRLGHRVFRRLRDSRGADLRARQRRGDGRRCRARRCTATTARCPATCRCSRCPSASSAWCPAGAAPSCCPT